MTRLEKHDFIKQFQAEYNYAALNEGKAQIESEGDVRAAATQEALRQYNLATLDKHPEYKQKDAAPETTVADASAKPQERQTNDQSVHPQNDHRSQAHPRRNAQTANPEVPHTVEASLTASGRGNGNVSADDIKLMQAELALMGHHNNEKYLKTAGLTHEDGVAKGNTGKDLAEAGVNAANISEAVRKVDEMYRSKGGNSETAIADAEGALSGNRGARAPEPNLLFTSNSSPSTSNPQENSGSQESPSVSTPSVADFLRQNAPRLEQRAQQLYEKVLQGNDPNARADLDLANRESRAATLIENQLGSGKTPLEADVAALVKNVKALLSGHTQGQDVVSTSNYTPLNKSEPQVQART